jgi:hypothetical protein
MQRNRQENMSSSNSNKAVKRRSVVLNDKQVEVGGNRGTEEEEEEESVFNVTSQLFLKPIENCKNLDKEVVLRRIRHRKRMNKVRAAVGAIFLGSSANNTENGDAYVQHKRWVDDAFAAL